MNRSILPLLLLVTLFYAELARTQAPADRELRAVWMATVLNIDYPKNPTTNASTLQAEFRSQLYRLRQAGINAVFLQVRPAGDAFYPTNLAPWSEWLTGRQGQAPVSDFDPLEFMIKEAHAKGIELHAWVNPYRIAMTMDSSTLAPSHLFWTRPEWVRNYGGRRYLDPGLPAVRAHLGEVIDELVANYDLDGIHFDDYFYPYPQAGEPFPDEATYFRYGNGQNKGDWRRENVNTFVAETHARIKAKKPWMRFGISPFGIWRNLSQDPLRGSATQASISSYDELFADALAWARAGTVDYLVPQLYFNIGFRVADYEVLARWWAANVPEGVHLYSGQAAYKVGNLEQPLAWNSLEEIPRQLALNRELQRYSGSVYFSARSILESKVGLAERLADLYPSIALAPPTKAGPLPAGQLPKLYKPKDTDEGKLIVWELPKKTTLEELPYYFAIYRQEVGQPVTLLHRTPFDLRCLRYHYYDKTTQPGVEYVYQVVPLDRYHRAPTPVAR